MFSGKKRLNIEILFGEARQTLAIEQLQTAVQSSFQIITGMKLCCYVHIYVWILALIYFAGR